MCGISVVCESGAAEPILERVRSMHDRAAHRGPDGEGWLAIDHDWTAMAAPTEDALRARIGGRPICFAAAFRWLRIQSADPASCQPMRSASGDTWVLFNGEIYNHRALRRELGSGGHAFHTRSDTEALLAAYEHWGPDCFTRLNGMWGVVIVDRPRRSIVLSRDRFGIRPLFYRRTARSLLIASEAKQIACLPNDRSAANRVALFGFLYGRRPGVEETYFKDVRAVPPATWTRVDLDRTAHEPPASPAFHRYWSLPAAAAPLDDRGASWSLAAASHDLDALLQDAVSLQAVAAVPVGALLSGGLDSSVVSVLLVEACRRLGEPSWLVSVTPEAATPALDERPFMRAVAAAVRGHDVTAIESPLDASWVERWMDRVTWHQEEPLPGVALVAQARAYHAAAAHGVRVVLEGTGADELFAGYRRHEWARLRDRLDRRQWLRGAHEILSLCRHDRGFGTWWLLTAGTALRHRMRHRARSRRGFAGGPPWIRPHVPPLAHRSHTSSPSVADGRLSPLARMSLADLTDGNVPAVLGIADRNAMASSIESRVPFLDHRVVELAFQLPDALKTSHGERKIVLRDVARRRLPAAVAERRARIGFGMPIADWMRGSLRPALIDAIHGPEVTQGDLFEPAETRRFVNDFLRARHGDAAAVWRIYALARWLRIYQAEG